MSNLKRKSAPVARVVDGISYTLPARVWDKIRVTDTCWLWSAHVSERHAGEGIGYGMVWDSEAHTMTIAHRYVYKRLVGDIPRGFVLDHLCDVTECVRPSHLRPTTQKTNIARGASPGAVVGRTNHCMRGHELDNDNTLLSGGRRFCRRCRALSYQRRRAKKGQS